MNVCHFESVSLTFVTSVCLNVPCYLPIRWLFPTGRSLPATDGEFRFYHGDEQMLLHMRYGCCSPSFPTRPEQFKHKTINMRTILEQTLYSYSMISVVYTCSSNLYKHTHSHTHTPGLHWGGGICKYTSQRNSELLIQARINYAVIFFVSKLA